MFFPNFFFFFTFLVDRRTMDLGVHANKASWYFLSYEYDVGRKRFLTKKMSSYLFFQLLSFNICCWRNQGNLGALWYCLFVLFFSFFLFLTKIKEICLIRLFWKTVSKNMYLKTYFFKTKKRMFLLFLLKKRIHIIKK